MAPHSITLAWKIPWAEEPDRLPTNKLEKQLLLQGHELHRLQGHNRWALAP